MSRAATRLARFLALRASERRLHAASALLLPIVAFGVRTLGTRRVCGLIERRASRASLSKSRLPAGTIAAAVARVADNLPCKTACLARSLVLHGMLLSHGHPSRLRIGVRLAAGKLDAHAWVESGATALNEDPAALARYAAFEGGSLK
jgi:hypothetical protein